MNNLEQMLWLMTNEVDNIDDNNIFPNSSKQTPASNLLILPCVNSFRMKFCIMFDKTVISSAEVKRIVKENPMSIPMHPKLISMTVEQTCMLCKSIGLHVKPSDIKFPELEQS